ncbi:Exosome complex exonuclease rrp45 [Fasciola hepatica]|uniref:Exosome complex exonuclease rrp45 n=1 Tax=Fasciola hepatica TaxID=6192 RepID=A0A4E0R616_FASHE|nr:Exosome complex exonuclease rrp45 [Fasciola hepatica]
MLSNAEVNTLIEMLQSGYRLDGRSLTEYREISFRFPRDPGDDYGGCCIVKIGGTSVVARVSAEVVEPKHFRPSQGMLFVNFDASLVQLPRNLQRKQNRDDESRRLSTVLQTLLRDSIDLDALCIVAWERVFAIRIEIRALSYDGNLGDCGALAAIASLASFRRPDVFVHDDGKVIVDTEAKHRPRVPLGIRRIPVLVTVALSADAKVILQDPTAREDTVLTGGRIMVGMTAFSEVCCLYTTGLSSPIRSTSLSRCIRMASSRAQSLVALVQRVLDGLKRQQEVALAASHARSSELENALESLRQAPLVLSSISFLPDEVNAPQANDALDYEEGEVIGDDWLSSDEADNMDVVSSSEDEETVVATEEPSIEKLSTHLDLYGVIEVPSRPTEDNPTPFAQQDWNELDESFRLPGLTVTEMNFPGSVFSAAELQRPKGTQSRSRKQMGRGSKTRTKATRRSVRHIEEEKHTTIVKLD